MHCQLDTHSFIKRFALPRHYQGLAERGDQLTVRSECPLLHLMAQDDVSSLLAEMEDMLSSPPRAVAPSGRASSLAPGGLTTVQSSVLPATSVSSTRGGGEHHIAHSMSSRTAPHSHHDAGSVRTASSVGGARSRELESLLEMLSDAPDEHPGRAQPARGETSAPPASLGVLGGSSKCAGLSLGPECVKMGRQMTVMSSTVCNSLRCVECDMRVQVFDGGRWSDSAASSAAHTSVAVFDASSDAPSRGLPAVGYMFFREHHPDRDKLEAGLTPASGWRAYCCQCSWVSVPPPLTDLPEDVAASIVNLRSTGGAMGGGSLGKSWRCAGH
jgi:hypothetical protein